MKVFLTLIVALLCAIPAYAAESSLSYRYFEQIPVLDNGRVKPLGAYAHLRLKSYAGQESINGQSANAWLAEVLFNPAAALEKKIFHIPSSDLKARLNLPPEEDYFNLPELQSSLANTQTALIELLDTPDAELTKDQKDLLAIHESALEYGQMLRSFSMLLPLNISVPEKYQSESDGEINFLQLRESEAKILGDLQSIIKTKGRDPSAYSEDEKAIALLAFQIQQIREGSQNGNTVNAELQILPSEKDTLISPWNALISADEDSEKQEAEYHLQNWLKLANGYREKDTDTWLQTTKLLSKQTPEGTTSLRLKTELLYLQLKPYTLAIILYALGAALLLFTLIKPNAKSNLINRIGIIIGLDALCVHIAAITARIYILERPPVGTLYESVLFVSAICAAIGLIITIKSKDSLSAIIGQIVALGLLLTAPVLLQSADSLELLVAVLNTNFWLATHVICITAGYGACILTACMAHAYMGVRLLEKPEATLEKLNKTTYRIALASLLLTAVGTVLGGIWADQSWGRFWGWDPKENGALLIVLWLIWILHARLSGHFKDLSFAAVTALLNVVVAVSWFGVNLLGVGLHSYGFTSGLAAGLFTFCAAEILIIAGLFISVRIKERPSPHEA